MRANAIFSLLTFGGGMVLAILGAKIHEYETLFWCLAFICLFFAAIIWAWPHLHRPIQLLGMKRAKQFAVAFDNFDCRVPTNLGGRSVIYYRLRVSNNTGRILHRCTGQLVGIGRYDTFGNVMPSNYAERLALIWATHTFPSVTSIDLRNGVSAFLDIVCVGTGGTVLLATPDLRQPNSFPSDFFATAILSVLTVSISADELPAQTAQLELVYRGGLHDSAARLL
jgi:hypothetical protein